MAWPAGVGVKANAGISAQVQQASGAIGYVDYSQTKKLGLAMAALDNQAGHFVKNPLQLRNTVQGIKHFMLAYLRYMGPCAHIMLPAQIDPGH